MLVTVVTVIAVGGYRPAATDETPSSPFTGHASAAAATVVLRPLLVRAVGAFALAVDAMSEAALGRGSAVSVAWARATNVAALSAERTVRAASMAAAVHNAGQRAIRPESGGSDARGAANADNADNMDVAGTNGMTGATGARVEPRAVAAAGARVIELPMSSAAEICGESAAQCAANAADAEPGQAISHAAVRAAVTAASTAA